MSDFLSNFASKCVARDAIPIFFSSPNLKILSVGFLIRKPKIQIGVSHSPHIHTDKNHNPRICVDPAPAGLPIL